MRGVGLSTGSIDPRAILSPMALINVCETGVADWLTAVGTVGACVIALLIALLGDWMNGLFFKPRLELVALVCRPYAERVGRQLHVPHPSNPNATVVVPAGEAWFFRLEVRNLTKTPAREVQVYLFRIEKIDGTKSTNVRKFTPMNLRWANTAVTNRKVLLESLPAFCDFIHVSEPAWKGRVGEDLDGVRADEGVMCLDVEATNTGGGHLLAPGAYRFFLYLAAENFPARLFVVVAEYSGSWAYDENRMLDYMTGFRMRTVNLLDQKPYLWDY